MLLAFRPMHRFVAVAFAAAIALFPLSARAQDADAPAKPPPARPSKYAPVAIEKVIKDIHAERKRGEDFLRYNGMSAFAAMQRVEFAGRPSLVIGSAPDCDLRIEDDVVMPHHVRITVAGDSFRVEPLADSAIVRIGSFLPRDTTVEPTSIAVARLGDIMGRYQIRLSHQRDPSLIAFDARAPRKAEFRGLKHYPVDLAWRYTGKLREALPPDTVELSTTRGAPRRALRVGWFDFMIGEKVYPLEAYRLLEPGIPEWPLAVFFKDATNGKETYRSGRFVDARPVGNSGTFMIDFNLAYNPACAYSDLYNCPLPRKENTLKIPVPAGERFPAQTAAAP